ncbi:hypothetical protein D3C85_1302910 [compost metagenome]
MVRNIRYLLALAISATTTSLSLEKAINVAALFLGNTFCFLSRTSLKETGRLFFLSSFRKIELNAFVSKGLSELLAINVAATSFICEMPGGFAWEVGKLILINCPFCRSILTTFLSREKGGESLKLNFAPRSM